MALSLLNYFFWDLEEARIPFMIADGVVIFALHYMEKGIKAEKAMREMEAEKQANMTHEQDKLKNRALKKQQRAEQKQQFKGHKKNNPNQPPVIIQQPNKKTR